jgi:hypothetical protein
MTVARVLLALMSAVLVAWFGVLARDDILAQQAAQRIHADRDESRADWTRSMDELREAEFLNPGTEWRIIRANYLLLRDANRDALRVAESVVRREPDNLDAWEIVLKAAPDGPRAAEARREIERLNPDPRTNAR